MSKEKEQPLDEDNIEDWDYYISPPPKTIKTFVVKVKYVGRAKPKPYYLEEDDY